MSLVSALLFFGLQALLSLALQAALPELSLSRLLTIAALGVFGAQLSAERIRSTPRAALLLAVTLLGTTTALNAAPTPSLLLPFSLPVRPFGWMLALGAWSALASWGIFRRGWHWEAVVGSLLWLAAVNAATTADMLTLGGGLLSAGFTLFAVQHTQRERAWEAEDTDYPTDLRLDILSAALGLTAGLLMLALLLSWPSPRPVWQALAPLSDALRERAQAVNRALGLRPQAQPPALAPSTWQTGTGLPREHLLGSGPELTETIVARIRVQEALPLLPYWRMGTYDVYTGNGWTWSAEQRTTWDATLPTNLGTGLLWQEVRYADGGQAAALAFGEVRYLDRLAEIRLHPPDAPFLWLVEGTLYRVWSAPPLASPAELRAAPTASPAWLTERYTRLPPETPPRLRALARALTQQAATPYDKALALEAYLRTFPYSLDLPTPPGDRDVTDYFLFDLRRGYCDYYATAFVVLARAVGLPTRLAIGYLGGTYQPENHTYSLSAADAHSWPEVYFPGYGWIPFEPTAGRPAIVRPETPPTLPPAPPPKPTPMMAMRSLWRKMGRGGGALALLGLAIGGMWLMRRIETWRLRRRPPHEGLHTLWVHLTHWAARGTDSLSRGATPLEIAGHLKGRLSPLAALPRGARLHARAIYTVDVLIEQIHLTWFSAHPPEDISLALHAWQQLRWFLLLARLTRWSWQRQGSRSSHNSRY